MTDLEATLAKIIENPSDDFPRLCYADLLEGQGELERSEFIRVQLRLAKSPCWHVDSEPKLFLDCASCQLRRREQELLNLHRLSWAWPLPEQLNKMSHYGETEDLPWTFRCGFIESLTCTWESWHTHADAITARHPIREVRLTSRPFITRENYGRFFAEDENYRRITEVDKKKNGEIVFLKWPKIRFEFSPILDPHEVCEVSHAATDS